MKKKKTFIWCVAVCVLLLGMIPVVANGATSGTCGDNLTWTYEGTTLTISGQGEMAIDGHAPWNNCHKTCTTVIIEDGVTSIGHNAFGNFQKLTTVTIPDTVTTIKDYAFSGCWGLTSAPLTEYITQIGQYAFRDCSSVTSVTIHAGLKKVTRGAFFGCGKLSTLIICHGVKELDADAFSGCVALEKVAIPDSVTLIGDYAFDNCVKLAEVSIGNGVTKISNGAFSRCTALTSVVLPNSVQDLGDWAFSECKNLSSVSIGKGMKNLKVMAFEGCTALKGFTLDSANSHLLVDKGILYTKDKSKLLLAPKGFSGSYTILPGTKKVGERAFYDCKKLTAVALPDSITKIENYAFDGCSALSSADLGTGLQDIAQSAFFGCSALKQIVFPAKLKTINHLAFSYCSSMEKMTFLGDKPNIYEIAFQNLTTTAYYPGNNATWKDMGLYGGIITWKALDCKGNHSPAVIKGAAATCTQNGKTDGSACSVCGQVLTSQRVVEASHSYGEWETKVPATAQTDGKAVRTCTVCGNVAEKVLKKLTGTTDPEVVPENSEMSDSLSQTEPTDTGNASDDKSSASTETTEKPEKETGEKKNNPWALVWIAVGVVIIADTVIGVFYLKNKKKKDRTDETR